MEKVIRVVTLTALLASAAYAGMGQILASWPAPASTFNRVNGIAFEGEYIWVKDRACEGSRSVVKCTKSGSIVKEIGFTENGWNDSYGLAFDGVYLWTVLHQPFGPVIYDNYDKYTTTGSYVNGFLAHMRIQFDPSNSVSWDGQYLWTDGRRKGQPVRAEKYTTAGSLLGSFDMPQTWSTAAGYYNRQIWAGGPGNYVYGMSTLGASVVASFPAPGGSCRAVGFDGEYLWTADANTPQYIYKVDIDVVDVEPGSFGKIKGMFR